MNIQQIENEVRSSNILHHPFLIKLQSGGYRKEQIKLWASQQFYFSNQFPRCLGALWCRISDYQISLPLMKFLAVEHWGSEESAAHWKQYRQILDYFGLTINDLKNVPAFDETREYLDYRFDVCLNQTVEEGLGCMGFAHELVNEKIFSYYYEGVKTIQGVPDTALEYFKSHVEDEPEDYQIFKNIILSFIKSEYGLELVAKGALNTLDKRILFFDKIKQRLDLVS